MESGGVVRFIITSPPSPVLFHFIVLPFSVPSEVSAAWCCQLGAHISFTHCTCQQEEGIARDGHPRALTVELPAVDARLLGPPSPNGVTCTRTGAEGDTPKRVPGPPSISEHVVATLLREEEEDRGCAARIEDPEDGSSRMGARGGGAIEPNTLDWGAACRCCCCLFSTRCQMDLSPSSVFWMRGLTGESAAINQC